MAKQEKHSGSPKFPYTTHPAILRKILKALPTKPKPDRLTSSTVVSWGAAANTGGGTTSSVGVLKKIGLLDTSNAPTQLYTEFMGPGTGPAALGSKLRKIYQPLFNTSHDPAREAEADLRNLFNVHSGGGDDAMRLQIQTFKALAEHATFDVNASKARQTSGGNDGGGDGSAKGHDGEKNPPLPPINIDLHIHLPENKTTRDYEAIIQDIAKYIYGKQIDGK